MLLAPLMNAGNFVLANTLIMYSVGFIGCLLIRNRYHLSLLPFVFLFLLFNFNGHITSHLSVGHSMWYGYFLLPLFFYFLLELLPPSAKIRVGTSIILAFVLFAIVLQGSFHIFVWCLIFLAILGFFNRHSSKDVARLVVPPQPPMTLATITTGTIPIASTGRNLSAAPVLQQSLPFKILVYVQVTP
jgi:hypothetical protein